MSHEQPLAKKKRSNTLEFKMSTQSLGNVLQTQLIQQERELSLKTKELEKAVRYGKALSEEKKKVRRKYRELKGEVAAIRKEEREARRLADELEGLLDEKKQVIIAKDMEVGDLRRKNESLEHEKKQRVEHEGTLATRINVLKSEKMKLLERIDSLKRKNRQEEAKIDELLEFRKKYEGVDLVAKEKEFENEKHVVESLRVKIRSLEEQIVSTRNSREKFEIEKDYEHHHLSVENQKLKADNQGLSEKIAELEKMEAAGNPELLGEKLGAVKMQLEQLKDSKFMVEQNVNDLMEVKDSMKSFGVKLINRVSEMAAERREEISEIEEAHKEKVGALVKAHGGALDTQKRVYEQKVREKTKEIEVMNEKYSLQILELEALVNRRNGMYEVKESEVEALMEKVRGLESEKKESESRSLEKEAEMRKMTNNVTEVKKALEGKYLLECEKVKLKNSEMEKLGAKYEALERSMEGMQSQVYVENEKKRLREIEFEKMKEELKRKVGNEIERGGEQAKLIEGLRLESSSNAQEMEKMRFEVEKRKASEAEAQKLSITVKRELEKMKLALEEERKAAISMGEEKAVLLNQVKTIEAEIEDLKTRNREQVALQEEVLKTKQLEVDQLGSEKMKREAIFEGLKEKLEAKEGEIEMGERLRRSKDTEIETLKKKLEAIKQEKRARYDEHHHTKRKDEIEGEENEHITEERIQRLVAEMQSKDLVIKNLTNQLNEAKKLIEMKEIDINELAKRFQIEEDIIETPLDQENVSLIERESCWNQCIIC